jgi:hypothetical protein
MDSTSEDEMTSVSHNKLVIDQIVRAFPVDSVPPSDKILLESQSENQEAIDTAEAFAGRTWNSMTAEELRYNYVSLSYFSPRAISYYLPGYMVAQLTDRGSIDVAAERIDYCLSETLALTTADSILAWFTLEQLVAIKNYYVIRMLSLIDLESFSRGTAPWDRDIERAFVNVLKWIEFHRARGSMASS